jgi:hypothetical protein
LANDLVASLWLAWGEGSVSALKADQFRLVQPILKNHVAAAAIACFKVHLALLLI